MVYTDQPLWCCAVELVVEIPNRICWQQATDHLFERACRRWHGCTEVEFFPPIQRWRSIRLPTDHPGPQEVIAEAAAGYRPGRHDPAGAFEAAIMMLSGCPTAVVDSLGHAERYATGASTRSAVRNKPDSVLISLFALDDDDVTLAEDLAVTVVAHSAGRILHRAPSLLPVRHEQIAPSVATFPTSPDILPVPPRPIESPVLATSSN